MKCEYCGTTISENDTFCSGCGSKVTKTATVQEVKPMPINETEQSKPINNYQTNNPAPYKRTSPVLIIVILLVVLGALGFAGYMAYDYFKSSDKDTNYPSLSKPDESDIVNDDEDDSDELVSDYKRVGTTDYGYINIPNEWVVFDDINEYDFEMMQYSNTEATEILTMTSNPNPSLTAEESATNVLDSMIEEGATDTEGLLTTVDDYTAYQAYGYYEDSNTWLSTWSFTDDEGTLHYVALESPDRYSDIFELINTYTVNK